MFKQNQDGQSSSISEALSSLNWFNVFNSLRFYGCYRREAWHNTITGLSLMINQKTKTLLLAVPLVFSLLFTWFHFRDVQAEYIGLCRGITLDSKRDVCLAQTLNMEQESRMWFVVLLSGSVLLSYWFIKSLNDQS